MKRHYLALWLLLVVALTAIAGFSYADDISIFGWKPKKAPIAEKLSYKMNVLSSDSLIYDAYKSARLLSNPIDSTSQVFLLFGDSMTLNLAYRLNDYAEKNGHTMYAVNWDSSNTKKWASSDKLDTFIEKYHPSLIFICLGSNELFFTNPEMLRPNIRQILDKIGDIPYIWIGPPNWKKDNGLNDMLEAMLPTGTYFRTYGLELERRSDHIHPTRAASEVWMDSIMRWNRKSAHPILADTPSKHAKSQSRGIFVFKPNE